MYFRSKTNESFIESNSNNHRIYYLKVKLTQTIQVTFLIESKNKELLMSQSRLEAIVLS